jgi:hypothetical protein
VSSQKAEEKMVGLEIPFFEIDPEADERGECFRTIVRQGIQDIANFFSPSNSIESRNQ